MESNEKYFYVRLIPMKVSDGKRMKKVNQPALHRLRHTENTQLKEIADLMILTDK